MPTDRRRPLRSRIHPSRLVAICFFVVSVLSLTSFAVDSEVQFSALTALSADGALTALQLFGSAFLFVASLYGIVRYEENPIVTEYGPTTYLLVGGALLYAIGLTGQLLWT